MHPSPPLAVIFTLFALSTPALAAPIINPSFEDVYPSPRSPDFGLPVGWNTVVYAEPGYDPWDTSWADQYDVYMFSPISPSAGQRMGIASSIGAFWQSVTLRGGDTILVDVAMATSSSHAHGAAIIALGTWSDFAASSSFYVPWDDNFGWLGVPWIGWQTLSLTVPATGTYDLMLFGSFGGNADGETHTYFDNIRVIPEPSTAALVAISAPLVARRRR